MGTTAAPGRGRRLVYAVAAWLFVGGVVTQIFLAGLGIFATDGDLTRHRGFGLALILLDLVLFGASAIGGRSLRDVNLAVGLGLLVILIGGLPSTRDHAPLAAALHPLAGSLLLVAAFMVALRATRAAIVRDDGAVRAEARERFNGEGGT